MPKKVKCLLKFRISVKPILRKKNGKEIPYVTECNHLGNILSAISDIPIVDHAVNDIHKRTNCLLGDFFLRIAKPFQFNTYCTNIMIVYCRNVFIDNCWNHCILPRKNVSKEFGKFLLLHIMFYYCTSIIL